MSADEGSGDRDRRLTALLAELDATPAPLSPDLAATVVRSARRQRTALAIVQLLLGFARAVPDAIAIGTGRRR